MFKGCLENDQQTVWGLTGSILTENRTEEQNSGMTLCSLCLSLSPLVGAGGGGG